jgi:hypothetical protein
MQKIFEEVKYVRCNTASDFGYEEHKREVIAYYHEPLQVLVVDKNSYNCKGDYVNFDYRYSDRQVETVEGLSAAVRRVIGLADEYYSPNLKPFKL